MKKIIYIVFSLIILLALGVFSTKAVTYNAANGIATGGTTGVSSYNWSDYVAGGSDNDEEIWYFDGEECVKGQPAYFITSGTYNSKAECEEDNESSSQTYTGGGGLGVSWNDDYTMEWTNPTQYGAYENSYTQTQQPTIGGLEGFQISGFNDDGGLGYSASPDALTVDKNVTPGFSFDGANEFTMFGTGITHDTTINGIQPLSIGGLNTPAISTNTTGGGLSGMFGNLLKSIAVDLGLKPAVSTLPTGNNLWKFTEVGDGDNILDWDEEKGFIFTTAEGLTDNATVPNDGTITFSWDATKNFKEGKCRLMKPMHSSFLATPTDKPLDLKGSQPIQFHITNGNDTADTAVTMKCYTKEQVTAGLKPSTNGISQSIKVKITKKEGGDTGSEDKDFTFEAKDTKLTLNKEGKAQTTLKWDIDSKIFSSCKTTAVDGTDWKEMEIERKKDGSKVVNFDKVDKEINYIFTITCETTTDKKKVIKTAEITVSPEGTTPGGDFKEPSWEAKQKINNDCSLSFKSLSTPTGSLLADKDSLVSSLNAQLVFACNNNKLEDKGSSTAVGYDARPFEYGLYIDVYNKNNFGVTPYPCATPVQPGGDEIVNTKNNFANLSCNPSTLSDAKAIQTALANNQVVRVVGYIDYKTYEITGFHHGQEHTVRLTNTTDKLGVGTGPAKPPEGDKLPTVTLSVDKTQVKCEEVVTLTATVENNGKSANCKLTSVNDNSKKPDEAWNSNQVINGKFEKKITLMGSSDKDVVYTYGIQCFKDDKDTTGVKATDIQIKVPKCVAGEGKTEWGEICNSTKEKCNKGQIQWSNQVNLNFENNEYKVKNSSALNFGVDFKCDTNPFEASFARLTIEDKIVQDVRLNKGAQSRVFAIPNIWEKLSDTTRNNIINTFKNCNGCDSVTIAKEKIWVARWNTFDEKNTLKKPEIDCNYSGDHPPSDLVFVGHNLPKKQAPGGGGSENNGQEDGANVEKCKTTCKQNLDNLSEADMISSYGGNSKQEAYQNCIAKCEDKPIPFPSQSGSASSTTSSKPTSNTGGGDNVGLCKPGYPKFTYFKPTSGFYVNQPCVTIDYSGCCIEQLSGFGIKYAGVVSNDFITRPYANLLKPQTVCDTTQSDYNSTTADTTLCLESGSDPFGIEYEHCKIKCIYTNKNGNTTSSCNFTGKIDCKEPIEKGKMTMKCVNCDKCDHPTSPSLYSKGKLGWIEISPKMVTDATKNAWEKNLLNGTTDLKPGTYRVVIKGCDKDKISGAKALNNGWVQDEGQTVFSYNNTFEIKSGQTTNLGTLSLETTSPKITPRVTLLDDQGNAIHYTTASNLYMYFNVDGYAQPKNTANILVTKNNTIFDCKLYVNNTEITQTPFKQTDSGSNPNNKSQSVIKTQYNITQEGKYEVFYRCVNKQDASQKIASNIATVTIKK